MAKQTRKSGAPDGSEMKGSNAGQEQIKKNFEELKKKEVLPQTRVVKLFYHCSGQAFERVVPFDSPLRDGQTVGDTRLPGDKLIPGNRYGRR